jgi:glycerol dehydrogenase-like iron-containing ADH family enzyme
MITTLIAPQRIERGWDILKTVSLVGWGKRVLVISGDHTRVRFHDGVTAALPQMQLTWATYGVDCTEANHARLCREATGFDAILGLGGGKALDMAKWVADSLGLPILTVPTSAATCAAWAPLSNVYSEQGTWLYGVALRQAPELLVVDYQILMTASRRTLVAGIGDALAKWYEASVSSSQVDDPLVMSAVQQARTLRDLLLLQGLKAVQEPGSRPWEQVIDGNICLAGLVGGLGGARCRTVAAHAVHNALTTLSTTRQSLHGEKVAYGILVQLRLEEMAGNRLADIARQQLLKFYSQIGLPTTLEDLHVGPLSHGDLQAIAASALAPDSDIHLLPFTVEANELVAALAQVEPVEVR